jgi:hypothetical protein
VSGVAGRGAVLYFSCCLQEGWPSRPGAGRTANLLEIDRSVVARRAQREFSMQANVLRFAAGGREFVNSLYFQIPPASSGSTTSMEHNMNIRLMEGHFVSDRGILLQASSTLSEESGRAVSRSGQRPVVRRIRGRTRLRRHMM